MVLMLIFVTGCENFYSKIYDKDIKKEKINCLKVESKDIFLKNRVIKALQAENIPTYSECPYTIRITAKFLSQCTSPTAKSVGADFDGFLRFDLLKDSKLKYRCQMDWKGEFSDDRIYDLIKKMKKDLRFKNEKM